MARGENLDEILKGAGGKVALIGAKPPWPEIPVHDIPSDKRACATCFFYRNGGPICQRFPMDGQLMVVTGGIKSNNVAKLQPRHYCCGEHRFEYEIPQNQRNWYVPPSDEEPKGG